MIRTLSPTTRRRCSTSWASARMCKAFKDHGPQGQRYPFEAIKYAVASILVGFGIETDRDYTIVGNRYYARLRRAEKRSS